MEKTKKRAGRKPAKDKKIQVALYVPQSRIDKFGGVESFKEVIYELIEDYYNLPAGPSP